MGQEKGSFVGVKVRVAVVPFGEGEGFRHCGDGAENTLIWIGEDGFVVDAEVGIVPGRMRE